jgi:DNA-binding MarR family transcriptional regulator
LFRIAEYLGVTTISDRRDIVKEAAVTSDDDAEARARIQAAVVHLIANVVLYNHVVAQRVGLGASDGQFMTLLNVHGPLTPGELAKHTGMTTGTVTGVLDRLEKAGLVERKRDTADRRRVVVTPREAVVAATFGPHYQGQAEHLDALLRTRTPAELAAIERFLVDIVADPAGQNRSD